MTDSPNDEVKWFLTCLKKVVNVIESETGVKMDTDMISTVAKMTSESYLEHEKSENDGSEDSQGGGLAHKVVERNDIVGQFKTKMMQQSGHISEEGKTALEFVYEKMLVMADDFQFVDMNNCNP